MFKKLAQQLREEKAVNSNSNVTLPIKSLKDSAQASLLKKLSHHALKLYERKTDVKNFTKLVLANPENDSHNELVDKLFADSVQDLSENDKFLKDLGLDS